MKKVIVLAGQESSFLHRLMDYINSRGEAEAFLYTDEEGLAEEAVRREASVVFCMEDFGSNLSLTIPRVEFRTEADREDGIYQFQPAGSIYKEMKRHIWKESPKRIVTPQDRKIYAVHSPLGRCGKTSFACAYAKEHSFFYIGMEEYGIQTNDFCSEGRLFYYIKNRKEDIIACMRNSMEEWEGIRIFGSPILFSDIRSLTIEDFSWFLDEIRKDSQMPSMIFDFGSGCLRDYEILDLFDQVFLPILSGKTEERKLLQYKELLYEVNGRMEDKLREIVVPMIPWNSPEFREQVRYMDGLT